VKLPMEGSRRKYPPYHSFFFWNITPHFLCCLLERNPE
jgi:hypothetical protein